MQRIIYNAVKPGKWLEYKMFCQLLMSKRKLQFSSLKSGILSLTSSYVFFLLLLFAKIKIMGHAVIMLRALSQPYTVLCACCHSSRNLVGIDLNIKRKNLCLTEVFFFVPL